MTISRTRSGVQLTSRYSMMHFWLHATSRVSDSELEITRPRLLLGLVPIGSKASVVPLSRIRFVSKSGRMASFDGWVVYFAGLSSILLVPSLLVYLLAASIMVATFAVSLFVVDTYVSTTSGIVRLRVWSPSRPELIRFCDSLEDYLAASWRRERVEGTSLP